VTTPTPTYPSAPANSTRCPTCACLHPPTVEYHTFCLFATIARALWPKELKA